MKFSDFITDKNGDGDEMRLAGWLFILLGAAYGIIKGFLGSPDWTGFTALTGFGTGLLFGGLLGDKVKPTVPPASGNPTAGVPQ